MSKRDARVVEGWDRSNCMRTKSIFRISSDKPLVNGKRIGYRYDGGQTSDCVFHLYSGVDFQEHPFTCARIHEEFERA